MQMSGDRNLDILILAMDLLYMSERQSKKFSEIPRQEILCRRRSLHTVSNAFRRSTKQA